MVRFLFLGLLVGALVLPVAVSATHGPIHLNLDYPAFGPDAIDLNELKSGNELPQLIGWVYYGIVAIAGLAAFFVLVYGGIQWLTSAGSPGKVADAQDRIKQALIGLVLVLGSFLIVQVVNPGLVNIRLGLLDAPQGQRSSTVNPSTFWVNDHQREAAVDPGQSFVLGWSAPTTQTCEAGGQSVAHVWTGAKTGEDVQELSFDSPGSYQFYLNCRYNTGGNGPSYGVTVRVTVPENAEPSIAPLTINGSQTPDLIRYRGAEDTKAVLGWKATGVNECVAEVRSQDRSWKYTGPSRGEWNFGRVLEGFELRSGEFGASISCKDTDAPQKTSVTASIKFKLAPSPFGVYLCSEKLAPNCPGLFKSGLLPVIFQELPTLKFGDRSSGSLTVQSYPIDYFIGYPNWDNKPLGVVIEDSYEVVFTRNENFQGEAVCLDSTAEDLSTVLLKGGLGPFEGFTKNNFWDDDVSSVRIYKKGSCSVVGETRDSVQKLLKDPNASPAEPPQAASSSPSAGGSEFVFRAGDISYSDFDGSSVAIDNGEMGTPSSKILKDAPLPEGARGEFRIQYTSVVVSFRKNDFGFFETGTCSSHLTKNGFPVGATHRSNVQGGEKREDVSQDIAGWVSGDRIGVAVWTDNAENTGDCAVTGVTLSVAKLP